MSSAVFKSLTDTTFDSVEGYRDAAQKAEDPQLKQALQQRWREREETLRQMNASLEGQGEEPVTSGTVSGEVHQMWQSVTSAFGSSDESVAERVEEGEDYLKGKFEEALQSNELEPSELGVVQGAYHEIREGEQFGDMIERLYD